MQHTMVSVLSYFLKFSPAGLHSSAAQLFAISWKEGRTGPSVLSGSVFLY